MQDSDRPLKRVRSSPIVDTDSLSLLNDLGGSINNFEVEKYDEAERCFYAKLWMSNYLAADSRAGESKAETEARPQAVATEFPNVFVETEKRSQVATGTEFFPKICVPHNEPVARVA
jgi:hypothetical protein